MGIIPSFGGHSGFCSDLRAVICFLSPPPPEQVQDVGEEEGGEANSGGETVGDRGGAYGGLRAGGGLL